MRTQTLLYLLLLLLKVCHYQAYGSRSDMAEISDIVTTSQSSQFSETTASAATPSRSQSSVPVTRLTKSTGKLESALNTFKRNSSVSLFSIFNGPGIQNISAKEIDDNGDINENSSINNWVQLSYRYKLTENISFVANPRFTYNYNTSGIDDNHVEVLNPVFGFNGLWYKNGDFKIAGVINSIIVPITESSKNDGLVFDPDGWFDITYRVNEDITVGAWYFGVYHFYKENSGKTRFENMISPKIDYSINDRLLLRTWVDIMVDHTGSSSNMFATERSAKEKIGFGFEYNGESGWGIFPYLVVNGEEKYSLATTSIGAWIYGLVF